MNIKNKKAYHNYEFIEYFISGIVLQSTEIKSIREGLVSFTDSYCYFVSDELFLKNCHISEYKFSKYFNHDPKRDRKLLLNKKELKKLKEKVNQGGLTIVPIEMFINAKGLCKIKIALARGKKTYDKRESIKNKDIKREENRKIKL